jgi:hypothetical protein
MTPAAQTPAILYLRVSSDKQGESGLGLEGGVRVSGAYRF